MDVARSKDDRSTRRSLSIYDKLSKNHEVCPNVRNSHSDVPDTCTVPSSTLATHDVSRRAHSACRIDHTTSNLSEGGSSNRLCVNASITTVFPLTLLPTVAVDKETMLPGLLFRFHKKYKKRCPGTPPVLRPHFYLERKLSSTVGSIIQPLNSGDLGHNIDSKNTVWVYGDCQDGYYELRRPVGSLPSRI